MGQAERLAHGRVRPWIDAQRPRLRLPRCHAAARQAPRGLPDIVGRGQSDWLVDKRHYTFATYCADFTAMLARLDGDAFDWVGTSLGGLIGMFMAAQPNSPIRRLVINDAGPFIRRRRRAAC